MRLTGVGGVFSASHQPPEGGDVHGHSYEVVAWFDAGEDARVLQARLAGILQPLDHTVLPADMASGEAIARHIGRNLPGCREVQVGRPLERIYARWIADQESLGGGAGGASRV